MGYDRQAMMNAARAVIISRNELQLFDLKVKDYTQSFTDLGRDTAFPVKQAVFDLVQNATTEGVVLPNSALKVNIAKLTNEFISDLAKTFKDQRLVLEHSHNQLMKEVLHQFLMVPDNQQIITHVYALKTEVLTIDEYVHLGKAIENSGFSFDYEQHTGHSENIPMNSFFYTDNQTSLSDVQSQINLAIIQHGLAEKIISNGFLSKVDVVNHLTNPAYNVLLGSMINNPVTLADIGIETIHQKQKMRVSI